MTDTTTAGFIDGLTYDANGLIPAIAQQHDTGEVLMMAWMNRESITETLRGGRVVYWSRSRKTLWRKGDTSGQVQKLVELRVDCDQDCLLLLVDHDEFKDIDPQVIKDKVVIDTKGVLR